MVPALLVIVCLAIFRGSSGKTLLSDSWAMLTSRPTQPTCVDIPRNFTLCHGIDYEKMRLPNLLEHETMDEVTQQASSWVPLLRLNCHTDTQLFLCALFAPVCLDREIQPCRSLCQAVQAGCEKRMRIYGFPWPEMLNCRKFPVSNDMCIQPRANYVLKVKIHSVEANHLEIKRGRAFKPRDSSARMNNYRNQRFYFNENLANCPCPIQPTERKIRYLVMANHTGTRDTRGEFVANLILPWKKDKPFKRSVRMFRKLNCETLGTQIRERARRERAQRYRKTYTSESPRRNSYTSSRRKVVLL